MKFGISYNWDAEGNNQHPILRYCYRIPLEEFRENSKTHE
jgi:hypothetical protein